jgi:hypothetical protein
MHIKKTSIKAHFRPNGYFVSIKSLHHTFSLSLPYKNLHRKYVLYSSYNINIDHFRINFHYFQPITKILLALMPLFCSLSVVVFLMLLVIIHLMVQEIPIKPHTHSCPITVITIRFCLCYHVFCY